MQILSIAGCVLTLTAHLASAGDVRWARVQLDGTFRSEGVATADVNRDGLIDVIAGDVWYQSPKLDERKVPFGKWTMRELRPVGKYDGTKGYSQSFANFAADVNGDGWDDAIVVGFPGAPFHWYENPQGKDGHWKQHVVWHSACNESPEFEDLDGDGKPEVIIGSQPEARMGYLSLPAKHHASAKWTFHAIGAKGDPRTNGTFRYYHGLGVGDVNRDGRPDVMIPHGFWAAPADRTGGPWKFHPWKLAKTPAGNPLPAANLYADDLDLDGDTDVIMSSAHAFGVWWFENVSAGQEWKFKYHLIDESYSQTHAMEYVDINGDGQKDIVTGKRYFAHQGRDPGGKMPVVMYWYEVKKGKGGPKFIRHEIEAGRDTGVGTQFVVKDINGDGRPDIVLSNKKGVNVLVQVK